MNRTALIKRETRETLIEIELFFDGKGNVSIETGAPFFDHMLTLFATHGFFDLKIKAKGDIQVDFHHTVEDVGITLGKAIKDALGDMKGITRYGSVTIPMEEALTEVHIDICNRPFLNFDCVFSIEKVGDFDTELVEEFFRAVSVNSGMTIHIISRAGKNTHHIIESIFKAFARSLNIAVALDLRLNNTIMSSKGLI